MALARRPRRDFMMADQNVNITALMDVLTVLLFFLIKSFTVSASQMTPPDGIKLPTSNAKDSPEETVMVSVSKNRIFANNDPIINIQKGEKFSSKDLGNDDRTLKRLQGYLIKELKKRNAVYKDKGNLGFLPPGRLLIMADRQLPYSILKYVLHTAAVSGYSDYQFVIRQQDQGL